MPAARESSTKKGLGNNPEQNHLHLVYESGGAFWARFLWLGGGFSCAKLPRREGDIRDVEGSRILVVCVIIRTQSAGVGKMYTLTEIRMPAIVGIRYRGKLSG